MRRRSIAAGPRKGNAVAQLAHKGSQPSHGARGSCRAVPLGAPADRATPAGLGACRGCSAPRARPYETIPTARCTSTISMGRAPVTPHRTGGRHRTLYRYEESERMLVPQDQGTLGVTPPERVAIEAGSYLRVLTHPDCAPAAYPVHIARQAHWTGDLPDVESPRPVTLVEGARLDPGAQYVPGGPIRLGAHRGVPAALADRLVWVDGFAIQTTPVTTAQYLEFLNDPQVDGLRWVPRERPNPRGEPGSLLIARRGDGRFYLTIDPDGDEWRPQMPVVYVDTRRHVPKRCGTARRRDTRGGCPPRSSGERRARGWMAVPTLGGGWRSPPGRKTCSRGHHDRSSPRWGASRKTAVRMACWIWVGTASSGRSTANLMSACGSRTVMR